MTATHINRLGTVLQGDLIAWGAAAIGIALVCAGVLWIKRVLQ